MPRLTLDHGPEIRQNPLLQAKKVLQTKPRSLVGSEMIYEIASSLQDILDNTWVNPKEVVALDEERAANEQAAQEKTRRDEEAKRQRDLQRQQEEERLLQELVVQRESRSAKRSIKSSPLVSNDAIGGPISHGVVRFERQSRSFKSPEGHMITINMVHDRIRYRHGRICEVSTVWPSDSNQRDIMRPVTGTRRADTSRDAPFLILKECFIPLNDADEASTKRAVQNLESKLELHMSLSSHPSIIEPLNFEIQRIFGDDDDDPAGKGWNVCILTELAEKNSLQETLEVVDKLDVKLVRAWSIQLIEGLHHYHRHGVAHANLHLSNILLQRDREAERGHRKIAVAMLSDGGYQRNLHLLKSGSIPKYFSPAWTAPEAINANIVEQESSVIAATDIWDFGRCFLQMAFGMRILNEKSSGPLQLIEEFPLTMSLRALLSQVFNNNPKKRPSAWDLLHFEFFRNDDSLFEGGGPNDSISIEASTAGLPADHLIRHRRESFSASAASTRYAKEFVEEGRLGRGGFGEVFRARNKVDGQLYAIKKVKARSKGALDPVLSEVTVLSRLKHPNVVRYFASWIEDGVSTEKPDIFGSSEDENTFSLTDAGHPSIPAPSSRGLDFISSTNAQVVFADDVEEGTSTEEDEDDSSDECEGSSQLDIANNHELDNTENSLLSAKDKKAQIHDHAVLTTLYIQMEYCKQEV